MTETSFFLFLGNADHEGVVSKLKTSGTTYKKKMLDSTIANWATIFPYLRNEKLVGVIGKLSTSALITMSRLSHRTVVDELMGALRHIPHILFIHETFFHGGPEERAFVEVPGSEGRYVEPYVGFAPVTEDVKQEIEAMLARYEINLVPYKRNAELTVLASEFVDQNERHLLLRMYVPRGKMWSQEAEKILQLFREYLTRISGLHVRQDQFTTGSGVTYEFVGDRAVDPAALPMEFDNFTRLVDLCATNPQSAMLLLEALHVPSGTVVEIVDRFAKEVRRLHIDLKQERERKLLSIRHRLEAELVDLPGADALDWNRLNAAVDQLVPPVGVAAALGYGGPVAGSGRGQNVTVNIRPQIINTVHGVVAQEINGDQHIGPEAVELLELIKLHGGTKAAELTSAVYELEDVDAKTPARLSARQRLKAFLYAASGKVGDVALGVLQTYIERKLGL